MSLAVKYRPKTFDEMVEQDIAVTILKNQVATRTFKNCYGFFGASGCGKTSLARCFARMINNGVGDPIEIDGGAAGNVDTIRELLAEANQRALVGEYKVIIIDEAQNIGGGTNKSAWAAMLKGLEDCAQYTIYILCSTNPEKIPEAILNRLQRYNFAPISASGIKKRLEYICTCEGFTNYEQTCDFISKAVNGGMRDAITYLEQVADYSTDLSIETAKKVFCGLSYETMFKLTWALQDKDEAGLISLIDSMYNSGQNLKNFIAVYQTFVIDLVKYKLWTDITVTGIPEYLATAENPVVQFTVDKEADVDYFNNLAELIFEIKNYIKTDMDYKSTIIIMLLKFMRDN